MVFLPFYPSPAPFVPHGQNFLPSYGLTLPEFVGMKPSDNNADYFYPPAAFVNPSPAFLLFSFTLSPIL